MYSDISSPYAHCPNTPQLARKPRITLTGRGADADALPTPVSTYYERIIRQMSYLC